MSTDLARREIERFLATDEPEVLCLKGQWGVGKTYAWMKFLEAAKQANTLALPRYAYVSLFGLTSIDQLRLSIVESSIRTENIGETVTVEQILADPLRVGTSHYRMALSYVRFVPGAKDIAELVQAASFLGVRQQLICIDDLERKGAGLKIKDVLGLVSYLKEHRACKIALILNDGAFDDDEKEDFNKYFEKTVDSHVVFRPSVDECAEIALAENIPLHQAMREHCIDLKIPNIRVIRRIERLGRRLVPLLDAYDPRVFQTAIKTLTLLGWCVYGEGAPSLEFVRHRRTPIYGIKQQPSEEEKKWGPLLDSYNFLYFSDMASLIGEGIQQGYFDDVALRQHAAKLHEGHQAKASEEDFHKAWRL